MAIVIPRQPGQMSHPQGGHPRQHHTHEVAICGYVIIDQSKYFFSQDIDQSKTPAWACWEKLTCSDLCGLKSGGWNSLMLLMEFSNPGGSKGMSVDRYQLRNGRVEEQRPQFNFGTTLNCLNSPIALTPSPSTIQKQNDPKKKYLLGLCAKSRIYKLGNIRLHWACTKTKAKAIKMQACTGRNLERKYIPWISSSKSLLIWKVFLVPVRSRRQHFRQR